MVGETSREERGEPEERGTRLSDLPLPEKAAEVRRLRREGMTWADLRRLVADELQEPAPTEEVSANVTKRDGSCG